MVLEVVIAVVVVVVVVISLVVFVGLVLVDDVTALICNMYL